VKNEATSALKHAVRAKIWASPIHPSFVALGTIRRDRKEVPCWLQTMFR
jgi:hypothetical protein